MTTFFGTKNTDYLDLHGDGNKLLGLGGNDSLLAYDLDFELYGGAGDDILRGLLGGGKFYGDAGNDSLEGKLGDTLFGGAGNDYLFSGQLVFGDGGNDILVLGLNGSAYGGSGDDVFSLAIGYAGSKIYGGDGNDVINLQLDVFGDGQPERVMDVLDGGAGQDTLISPGDIRATSVRGFEILKGIAFATLYQLDDFRRIEGDDGVDFVKLSTSGGGFADLSDELGTTGCHIYMYGSGSNLTTGDGNDAIGGEGDNVIFARGGDDYVTVWTGSNEIHGGSGNDTLANYPRANDDNFLDQLWGEEGNDVLVSDTRSSVNIYGGTGNDRISLQAPYGNISGGGGEDTLEAGHGLMGPHATNDGDISGLTMSGIEVLSIVETIDCRTEQLQSFVSIKNYFDSAFPMRLVTIFLTNDGVVNLASKLGERAVVLHCSNVGATTVSTSVSNDSIFGGGWSDSLFASDGNDLILDDSGWDTLNGGNGDDSLYAGIGEDRVFGGNGSDEIDSGSENDRLFGGADNDTVFGEDGADIIDGGSGDDRIFGGDGDDIVEGVDGNDTLMGGAGADTLLGGLGKDVLYGGSSGDVFFFNRVPDARDNVDVIGDFHSAADFISLSHRSMPGLGTNFGSLSSSAFWSAKGATAAHDDSDRVIYNESTGALYYDADGIGGVAAVWVARLENTPVLLFSDIQIG